MGFETLNLLLLQILAVLTRRSLFGPDGIALRVCCVCYSCNVLFVGYWHICCLSYCSMLKCLCCHCLLIAHVLCFV